MAFGLEWLGMNALGSPTIGVLFATGGASWVNLLPEPGAVHLVVGYQIVQRLVEVAIGNRNHRALKARGGVEYGAVWHYRQIVAIHVCWLLSILAVVDPKAPISVPLLIIFIGLQIARVWVIGTLGQLWTTRVIVLPGGSRIRTGPYRLGRHPVYCVVAVEVAVLPLMFGAWVLAAVAAVVKLLWLRTRIRIENRALAEVYGD